MSDTTTIARPYARAIFEHALANDQLASWSAILYVLAQATLDPAAQQFIDNPASTIELQCELLGAPFSTPRYGNERKVIENLITLLAKNKRLMLLPDINVQYAALRAAQEKTLTVSVRSFSALSEEQQQHLIKSLSQRLQRQISLEVDIDKSLLGGAVIRAGDLVIDGSVRGKLNKLGTSLAA
ncbi:F0F1 ATP synthase subunit delta [Legionella oakridgensis]|uniref:F0F1 ATP synthase subunit delta n=1 Tax=Legionella oakridgensis TaxID=29423 RepID=UPI0003DE3468|nr:F0F1 ATP synthase subunit delta [Legionella oakridgensis]ETO92094.1 ATP synthase, F1 delta subunit [Legionella oakridgensis RV-2-2007]